MVVDEVTGGLFAGWRWQIDAILADAVPHGPLALVNFPNHRNAGDPAIWLAEREALARVGPVRYRCSWDGFSHRALRRRVGDGAILLNGGGNFGDLYAGQQGLREHILATCRANPVVQLPQSIWFDDPANLDRVRRLIAGHGQVTILCRDRRSEHLAREQFEARVVYCPDMVLGWALAPRPAPPAVDVLWLARRDPEAVAPPPDAAPDVEVCDWLAPLPGEREWPAGRRLAWEITNRWPGAARRAPRLASATWRLPASRFEPLAEAWVARARRVLARGRVVVTDRLHAHVLALGMGIPTVVLDSSYGKVHAVARESTVASPLTHLAGGTGEALDVARALVAAQAEDPPPQAGGAPAPAVPAGGDGAGGTDGTGGAG